MANTEKLKIYEMMYKSEEIINSLYEDNIENVIGIFENTYPDMTDNEIVNTIIDFREQERNLLAMIQEALADMDTYKVIFDRNRENAYDFAKMISSGYSYDEFNLFMDVVGSKFVMFGSDREKYELSAEELDEVVGGNDILEIAAKWFKLLAKLSGNCFTEKVMITMADGTEKSIKDVVMGDKIISLDRNLKPNEATVTHVLKPAESKIYEVAFTDGRKLETTETQWLFSGEEDFPIAGAEGKNVLLLDGSKAEILSVTDTGRSELVYDLTVSGDTNYMFVNKIAAEGIGT